MKFSLFYFLAFAAFLLKPLGQVCSTISDAAFLVQASIALLVLIFGGLYARLLTSLQLRLLLFSLVCLVVFQLTTNPSGSAPFLALSFLVGLPFCHLMFKLKLYSKLFLMTILLTISLFSLTYAQINNPTFLTEYSRLIDDQNFVWKFYPILSVLFSVYVPLVNQLINPQAEIRKIVASLYFILCALLFLWFAYSTFITITRTNIIVICIQIVIAIFFIFLPGLVRKKVFSISNLLAPIASVSILLLVLIYYYLNSPLQASLEGYLLAMQDRGGLLGDDQGTLAVRATGWSYIYSLFTSYPLQMLLLGIDRSYVDTNIIFDPGLPNMIIASGMANSALFLGLLVVLLTSSIKGCVDNQIASRHDKGLLSHQTIFMSIPGFIIFFLISGGWSTYSFLALGMACGFIPYTKARSLDTRYVQKYS